MLTRAGKHLIFDTHCHLGFDGTDAAGERARAHAAGVSRMLTVGTDAASSARAAALAAASGGVWHSAGLHPCDADRQASEWSDIERLARDPSCVAVGETGLDFYWDRAPHDAQTASFAAHLELAAQLGKPIIVHCRDAFDRTFEMLRAGPDVGGVMHCFSGGLEEARQALDLGLHLSFAGPLTYPKAKALREAAAFAPDDRILVETDSPFLPPQGRRGERNEPAFIVATLGKLAEIRGWTPAEAAETTTANGLALFGV